MISNYDNRNIFRIRKVRVLFYFIWVDYVFVYFLFSGYIRYKYCRGFCRVFGLIGEINRWRIYNRMVEYVYRSIF